MKFLSALGLLAVLVSPSAKAQPTGDQILRQMSATLAAAPALRFSATREIDGALLDLPGRRFKARVDVLVRRPDKFAATSVGRAGLRRFVADGRTLTLYEARPNFYTAVPMPATLDLLVARLDEKFGFTPPLAEFALSDPYREFRRDATTVKSLGRTAVGGGFLGLGAVACEHLALAGKEADAEIWIGVEDHLPRRLVATFKNDPGRPQLRVDFHRWDLAPRIAPSAFTFVPPPGAKKIEMWSVDQMQSAAAR